MTLFEESVHGLRARVRSLQADLKLWVARTSSDGDLPQHHTQVARLNNLLAGTLSAVVAGKPIDPDIQPPFAGTLDDVAGLRRGIGSVHLMWEFFRDKLAQRDMTMFAAHLGAADDLAWACYQPFLEAATAARVDKFSAAAVKEPPLVFYSTDRSPFAQARTKTLHPLGLDSKDLAVFAAALQRLPVPVIGVPWEVANRMPEVAMVGHEAGHVIAEDLGVAVEAKQALSAASFAHDSGDVRKSVWLAWSDEILADVVGVLATGSAFVEGLAAELAGSRDEIRLARIDTGKPGRYPTPTLRVALCENILGRVGVTPSTAWSDSYSPIVGDSSDYVRDVDVVAGAVLDRSWAVTGGTKLEDQLPWDATREQDARTVAEKELLQEFVPVPFDVRTWVAASMHAYRDDPATYETLGLDRTLADFIVGQRGQGVRSSCAQWQLLLPRVRSIEAGDEGDDGYEEALEEADRRAGVDIARLLGIA